MASITIGDYTQQPFEKVINKNDITENGDIIIDNTEPKYVHDNDSGKCSVYMPFTATSVCSAVLTVTYPGTEFENFGEFELQKLTNTANAHNLYAIRVNLDDYNRFSYDEQDSRTIIFKAKVCTCNNICNESILSIEQEGCMACKVIFNWGRVYENDEVIYRIGSNIKSSDIKHTVEEVMQDGHWWDGNFYYDRDFRNKVHIGYAIATRNMTIYANMNEMARFKVVDSHTLERIGKINIEIGDIKYYNVECCQEGTVNNDDDCYVCDGEWYLIGNPTSSNDEDFIITISAPGYTKKDVFCTFSSLNEMIIRLDWILNNDEFMITTAWNGERNRIKVFLEILDLEGNALSQDDADDKKAMLFSETYTTYYNQGPPTVTRDWIEQTGYSGEVDNLPCSAMKKDNNFYELDCCLKRGPDDRTELITGTLSPERIYRFTVKDEDGDILTSNPKVSLLLGNIYYPSITATYTDCYYVTDEPDNKNKAWWSVFEIKVDSNGTHRVTKINACQQETPLVDLV